MLAGSDTVRSSNHQVFHNPDLQIDISDVLNCPDRFRGDVSLPRGAEEGSS